jgi:hypothetical protein
MQRQRERTDSQQVAVALARHVLAHVLRRRCQRRVNVDRRLAADALLDLCARPRHCLPVAPRGTNVQRTQEMEHKTMHGAPKMPRSLLRHTSVSRTRAHPVQRCPAKPLATAYTAPHDMDQPLTCSLLSALSASTSICASSHACHGPSMLSRSCARYRLRSLL